MRLLRRAALIALALCTIAGASARAATDPATAIRNFYATLVETMKQGPQLGESGRYNALAPAIRRDFDLSAMTRMAVGPGWAQLSPAEREQVTEAFARYTIATYADHFAQFKGEKLEVTGERKMPYGTVVDTQIVQPDGDRTSINYVMRQNGDAWQVADIYLQGTISQIANLRSQFSGVFQQGGARGLADTLNRKAASLVPTLAAS